MTDVNEVEIAHKVAITDAETAAHLAMKAATQKNEERLAIGAAAVNLFNMAVQQQAGRTEWNAADFRSFMIAFASVDSIGAGAVADIEAARHEAQQRVDSLREETGWKTYEDVEPVPEVYDGPDRYAQPKFRNQQKTDRDTRLPPPHI